MASLYVKTTSTKNGKTYAVKYRRGGRYFPVEHGGSFKTLKEANARKQKVAEWLALGLDPQQELRKLTQTPVTMAGACDAWLASRRSISDTTRDTYRGHVARIRDDLKVAPSLLTAADVNEWVTRLEADYQPRTIGLFVGTLRSVLDHAGVSPNPARDRRVELPRASRREVDPPTAEDFLKVLQHTNRRYRRVIVLLEQTGMRVSEAVELEWRDVDRAARCRLRVSAETSKTNAARWVEVADWVLSDALGSQNGKPRVFPGFTRQKIHNALKAACVEANVKPFGPHALRHRRASIMHMRGVPVAQAAAFLGHSAREHLDTYAHVMPVDEVAVHDLLSALV